MAPGAWTTGVWSTGVWTTGVWTTGVRTTGVWTTGVWTTGVWTTDVWTTGVWTTGVWTTGVWTTGVWTTGVWTTGVWTTGVHRPFNAVSTRGVQIHQIMTFYKIWLDVLDKCLGASKIVHGVASSTGASCLTSNGSKWIVFLRKKSYTLTE